MVNAHNMALSALAMASGSQGPKSRIIDLSASVPASITSFQSSLFFGELYIKRGTGDRNSLIIDTDSSGKFSVLDGFSVSLSQMGEDSGTYLRANLTLASNAEGITTVSIYSDVFAYISNDALSTTRIDLRAIGGSSILVSPIKQSIKELQVVSLSTGTVFVEIDESTTKDLELTKLWVASSGSGPVSVRGVASAQINYFKVGKQANVCVVGNNDTQSVGKATFIGGASGSASICGMKFQSAKVSITQQAVGLLSAINITGSVSDNSTLKYTTFSGLPSLTVEGTGKLVGVDSCSQAQVCQDLPKPVAPGPRPAPPTNPPSPTPSPTEYTDRPSLAVFTSPDFVLVFALLLVSNFFL